MTPNENLAERYRAYIDCLNKQDWDNLGSVVHEDVHYNGTRVGLTGYRQMLVGDFEAIPDLSFNIDFLVCEPPRIAARLLFGCTPKAMLFGLPVNGRKVNFSENVFYTFREGRVVDV
ncbi:ester cyclase [Roseibium sp.]